MPITYSVIIPANGIGLRFKNEIPKQFVSIRNRPLIYYTINSFVNFSNYLKDYKLNEIVVSCSEKFFNYMRDEIIRPIVEKNKLLKINLVIGGEFRHQSIFNCLKYLSEIYKNSDSEHIIIIQDAVRPLIDIDLLENLIINTLLYGASGPICNLTSTILKTDENNFLVSVLNRDEYKASEMPQSFKFNLIWIAYNAAEETDIQFGTECLDLIRKYTNCRIKLIPSNANNLFKVTYKKDYFSALCMIKQRLTYKTCVINKQFFLREFNLIKFESNLESNNSNDLDANSFEFVKSESTTSDILFAFITYNNNFTTNDPFHSISELTYGHFILIYLFLNEQSARELVQNYSQSFLHCKKLTILFCFDNDPIDNLALYEKIKLICNNQQLMVGQFMQI